MAEINATILIYDISGFTQFMSTTELSHSSLAVNILIDTMINSVTKDYQVSEIEGDAVVLVKKDPAPTTEEIYDMCLRIFNTFHFQRMWMQQHTICPCKACVGLENLTLKFIVHRGPLAEIKMGGMLKHSGTEMIVAHRLMKNSIPTHEYVLMTNKLMEYAGSSSDPGEVTWSPLSETFESIGEVGYRFATLNEVRKKIQGPVMPKQDYFRDDTPYLETSIGTHFMNAYMNVMNIPGRDMWVPGLKKVEQFMPGVFIGSVHQCEF